MNKDKINTLGELKKAGYKSKSIKEELRQNLLQKIKKGDPAFEGIHGYEYTVIPELERAILSKHNINLLGSPGTWLKRRVTKLPLAGFTVRIGFLKNSPPQM